MAKHRRMSRSSKKVAAIGVATVTATALTVGAAPPQKADDARMDAAAVNRDVALSAAIDYTQLITDSSNSLDNLLLIFGNVGGGAADAWNPIAVMVPGGLLPTFTAGTTPSNLLNLGDLLGVLTNVPNVGLVPGITPEAAAIFLDALAAGLVPITGLVSIPGLGSIGDLVSLAQLTDLLGALETLSENPLVAALGGIGGIPALEDLLDELGLIATSTAFQSTYDWPILGIGGTTTIGNTFAQVPSISVADLTGLLLGPDGLLDIPVVNILVDGVEVPLLSVVEGLLGDVATPSITAWIPAASGSYSLPLGGSIGWLATMPTIAIGPLDSLLPGGVELPGLDDLVGLDDLLGALGALGIAPEVLDAIDPLALLDIDLSAETVIAIPIFAAGATLPLGLGAFSIVTTPGITFPTATGVSTIAGTTVMSFNILGFGFTNVNTLASTYAGTNGINHNSGQNVLTLTTPLGPIPIPIAFSLGSFNTGTTGFGFTGPSLFGIGLLPPFQVGTAPSQQSADGLISAALLNLFLAPPAGIAPTQLTDLGTLLGLPNPFDSVESVLNPLFDTAVAPFGSQITDALNSNIGPLTNGFASGTEQLTALLAQLTGGVAPAATSTSSTSSIPSLGSVLGLLGGSGLDLSSITDLVGGLVGNALGSSPLSQPEALTTTSFAPSNVGSTSTGSGQTLQLTQEPVGASASQDPPQVREDKPEDTPRAPKERKGPILNALRGDGNSATPSNASKVGAATGTNGPTPVKDAATQAGGQLKKTADGLSDGLKKAADNVKKALGGNKDNDNDDNNDNNE